MTVDDAAIAGRSIEVLDARMRELQRLIRATVHDGHYGLVAVTTLLPGDVVLYHDAAGVSTFVLGHVEATVVRARGADGYGVARTVGTRLRLYDTRGRAWLVRNEDEATPARVYARRLDDHGAF